MKKVFLEANENILMTKGEIREQTQRQASTKYAMGDQLQGVANVGQKGGDRDKINAGFNGKDFYLITSHIDVVAMKCLSNHPAIQMFQRLFSMLQTHIKVP